MLNGRELDIIKSSIDNPDKNYLLAYTNLCQLSTHFKWVAEYLRLDIHRKIIFNNHRIVHETGGQIYFKQINTIDDIHSLQGLTIADYYWFTNPQVHKSVLYHAKAVLNSRIR
jgi:hypothetical protein